MANGILDESGKGDHKAQQATGEYRHRSMVLGFDQLEFLVRRDHGIHKGIDYKATPRT